MNNVIVIGLFSISVLSCRKDAPQGASADLAAKFTQPQMDYPLDNLPSEDRTALGKYLFYNPALSIDSSISCSSCHQQHLAFADNRTISLGAGKQIGKRNSPTLSNIGFHPYFTFEGGVQSLETQVLVPIQEHEEFNNNIIDIGKRLEKDTFFVSLSQKAYPDKPYYYAITRGLSAFERTFVSDESKFDLFLQGKVKFSEDEIKGLTLFMSPQANCIQCHSGFNFTNYQFENNGATYLLNDNGRYRLTKKPSDIGLFKVPTLRNIALTAPYMHDGSISSLFDVIQSYNLGGMKNTYKNKQLIKPLDLNQEDVKNLEAFLNTLTDYSFITSNKFKKNDAK